MEKGDFVRSTYSYSAPRGWLDSINAAYGAGAPFYSASYARNANGTIASTSLNDGWLGSRNWSYPYDGFDRLSAATSPRCRPEPLPQPQREMPWDSILSCYSD